MKKTHIIAGILYSIFLFAGIVHAVNITVPSAPSDGYALVSTTTGAYQATTTDPFHAGAFYATSTVATSTFAGGLNMLGFLGIGTTTPPQKLTVIGNIEANTDGSGNINQKTYSNSIWGNVIASRARGTQASPSSVQTNDLLGTLGFSGYVNGSGFLPGPAMFGFATENWVAGSLGSSLGFATIQNGNTSQTRRMTIDQGGNVGIASTSPGTLLSIGNGGGINFTLATSTFSTSGGINLLNGCYAIGGTCLSSGGGGGLTGSTGQVAYFSGTDTAVGTSTLFILPNGNVGVGTVTPAYALHVIGNYNEFGDGPITATNKTTTQGVSLTLDATGASGTGHRYSLTSTGSSASSGAGVFVFLDDTAGAYRMSIDGGGNITFGGLPAQNFEIYPTYGGSGEIPAGNLIDTHSHSLAFLTEDATHPIVFNYFSPTVGFNSAIDINGASSGFGTLNFMKSGGNVGIGTTSPYAVLSVQSNSVTTVDVFAVATSSGATVFGIDADGHRFSGGPAGAISTCGTGSGSVVGDDNQGTITTATAATACTYTFAKAWSKIPVCIVTDDSLVGFASVASVSTTAVTFGISSALTGGKLYYSCSYHR